MVQLEIKMRVKIAWWVRPATYLIIICKQLTGRPKVAPLWYYRGYKVEVDK